MVRDPNVYGSGHRPGVWSVGHDTPTGTLVRLKPPPDWQYPVPNGSVGVVVMHNSAHDCAVVRFFCRPETTTAIVYLSLEIVDV